LNLVQAIFYTDDEVIWDNLPFSVSAYTRFWRLGKPQTTFVSV